MPSIGNVKRPRRVLIIVENLPVPLDRRVWAEATTLRSAGYDVAIICPTGAGAESRYEYLEGIHVYRHSLPIEAAGAHAYLVEYAAALFHQLRLSLKIARRHGFDVIHACNPPDLIFLVGIVYRLFGKKFLFDHHDLNPELFEGKFNRRGLFYWLLVLCERLTFALATASIATNESYRQVAIERGKMKPENVFVVRSGPKLDKVRRMPSDPKWKNGRKFMAGYVGVIGQQEGLDLLLEAVRHIVRVRERDDVQFVVVGSGPEQNAIGRMASDMGLDSFVTFTGRVPDDLLMTILSTADICVNPDRVNALNDKSTMNKILEYMALGKPIVQFDVTEGRFSAGEASLYADKNDPIDFGNKILELLADEHRRDQMGLFGRKRIETQLSWDYEAPKLLAAYKWIFEK
jgi:glycosyltransferase involved in cell wall biosynthesis